MTLYELGCEYDQTEKLLTRCIHHARESLAKAAEEGQVQRAYEIRNYLTDLYAQRVHVRQTAEKLKHYYDEVERQETAPKPRALLVTTRNCPNCVYAEHILTDAGVAFEKIVANDQSDVAERFDVLVAPTLIFDHGDSFNKVENLSNIIKYVEERGGAT